MEKNRKIYFLNIIIFIIAFLEILFIATVGNQYTLHTNIFLPREDAPKVAVNIEKKGIVEFQGARMENGELVLDFSSIERGETKVHAGYQFSEEGGMISIHEHSFKVSATGVIMDRTLGELNFNGYQAVIISVLLGLFFTEIIMLWIFFSDAKKGLFSYRMIALGGLGIYNLVILMFLIYKLMNNVVKSFSIFLVEIAETSLMLIIAITPVMLVLSIFLMASNIWLIRHEGRRPINMLGIAFGLLWFLSMVLVLGGSSGVLNRVWSIPFLGVVRSMAIYVVGYLECMFLATVISAYLAVKYTPPLDQDYIIILGCAIRKDGTLTPLLKGRVDSAIAFEKKQFEKNGKHAIFVPSGGQGADEIISEGEAMERYLLGQNVPKEQILREDQSKNTDENIKFSKRIIEDAIGTVMDRKIAFATTNYHVFRGYILAEKNEMRAKGIASKTKAYFYPNAFLREFIGLLVEEKWRHIGAVLFIMLSLLQLSYWVK